MLILVAFYSIRDQKCCVFHPTKYAEIKYSGMCFM